MHLLKYAMVSLASYSDVLETVDLNLLGGRWWKNDKGRLMAQLKDWIPQHLRFCRDCVKYRPRRMEYWNVPGNSTDDKKRRERLARSELPYSNCPEYRQWTTVAYWLF